MTRLVRRPLPIAWDPPACSPDVLRPRGAGRSRAVPESSPRAARSRDSGPRHVEPVPTHASTATSPASRGRPASPSGVSTPRESAGRDSRCRPRGSGVGAPQPAGSPGQRRCRGNLLVTVASQPEAPTARPVTFKPGGGPAEALSERAQNQMRSTQT
jgi:hypothetical protein